MSAAIFLAALGLFCAVSVWCAVHALRWVGADAAVAGDGAWPISKVRSRGVRDLK